MISEKKKIYLLLLETGFQIVSLVIALLLYNKVGMDFLTKNLFYQLTGFILLSFIYFNLLSININLKIASILKFIILITNLIICLIPSVLPGILLMNTLTIDALEFISSALEIPFVYFLYKGLSRLVFEKSRNEVLVSKLDKLLIANVILAIYNFIIFLIKLFGLYEVLLENLLLSIFISLALSVFSIVLGILEVIYIFKVAKEPANTK